MGIAASIIGGGLITLAVAIFSLRKTTEDLKEVRDEIQSDLRENVDVLVTVARGLEEAFRSGHLEFNYDDDGKPVGIVMRMSITESVGFQDAIEEIVKNVGDDGEDD